MTELIWDGKYEDGKKVAPVSHVSEDSFQGVNEVPNGRTNGRKKL